MDEGCAYAKAIVSRGADPGRHGRELRRLSDRPARAGARTESDRPERPPRTRGAAELGHTQHRATGIPNERSRRNRACGGKRRLVVGPRCGRLRAVARRLADQLRPVCKQKRPHERLCLILRPEFDKSTASWPEKNRNQIAIATTAATTTATATASRAVTGRVLLRSRGSWSAFASGPRVCRSAADATREGGPPRLGPGNCLPQSHRSPSKRRPESPPRASTIACDDNDTAIIRLAVSDSKSRRPQ